MTWFLIDIRAAGGDLIYSWKVRAESAETAREQAVEGLKASDADPITMAGWSIGVFPLDTTVA
jgi:hypothetical protein